MIFRPLLAVAVLLAVLPPAVSAAEEAASLVHSEEVRFQDVRQLTFGGENAEAYWSPDGKELTYQAKVPPYSCDQIFRISAQGGEPSLVSTGKGRTTCAYFSYPQGDRIYFASTHEADAACPQEPDRSQGYVWPIYGGYEIYSSALDGSDLKALTDNEVYDAEATVCPVDGTVLFTSTRDGDLELYTMRPDGSEVRRITNAPGYDGGAFFSQDCERIVWRASRPQGETLADYQRLLAQGLVRPGKLEIWVADRDGTNARQVTYLNAASFAPYFFPSGDRIIFSTNYGDPRGREFDLWAVNVDGSRLERITHTPEFDGFPMFSPDGKYLAFGSNRNNAQRGDTNVFVARWVDHVEGRTTHEPSAADRIRNDVAWLAADSRLGRGLGTQGLEESAHWLASRFEMLGLAPAGEDGTYFQTFEVTTQIVIGADTRLSLDGEAVAADGFVPAWFSASTTAEAPVVAVGYGIVAPELEVDDYAGLDVEGKIVLVRRFTPTDDSFDDDAVRRYSDLRHKAFTAREKGAVGVVVVDLPPAPTEAEEAPEEAALPSLRVETGRDVGIPVVIAKREEIATLWETGGTARLEVDLTRRTSPAMNVLAVLRAGGEGGDSGGPVLLGAHYDHLGNGGSGSLAPDSTEIHNGADDNASGTAALVEAARLLSEVRSELTQDIYFAAFSGEESGLLGSTHFTRQPTGGLELDALRAMINMDMVGRLRRNRLSVLGTESAEEWDPIVAAACAGRRVACETGGDGYGASDQTPFYAAGVPVLHLFTGIHDDYHRPSDDARWINAAGGAQVAAIARDLTVAVAERSEPLTYKHSPQPPPRGDTRSYGASLGTIPDYAGPDDEAKGVLLSGVRPGSPAEEAGMRRGDLLVELGGKKLADIYDFVFVLRSAKPGDKATAVVERDGQRIELVVTYGISRGMR